MDDRNEFSTADWAVLSAIREDTPSTYMTQDDFNDDKNHIRYPVKAHIIMTGVENSVKIIAEKDLTVDYKSNEGVDNVISSHQSLRWSNPSEIKESLKVVSKYRKRPKESTFYQDITQYSGTIQSIDKDLDIFTANLVNIDDVDDKLLAEFYINDYNFGSDMELIQPGANFIWLIGQEVEHGTRKKTTKFIFRRTPIARGRALQEAKDKARELAELFSTIGTSEN